MWKDIVEKAKTYKGWGCRACIRRRWFVTANKA
jgi:hypothetical protein